VRDAAWGAEGLAGSEAHLPVGQEQRDLALEDVEDLVFRVMDVQWRHVTLRDVILEQRIPLFGLVARDVDVDESVDEPEWRKTRCSTSRHRDPP
jgi:hypothetical protein